MFSVLRDLLRYNVEFAFGAVLTGIVVIFACLSFFSPVDPTLIYNAIPDQPPSWQYWFGTNSRGQEMFWQLSFAFRNTLSFGITVALLSRVISIVVGLAAGYLGGWVDRVLMGLTDIFLSMPKLILALGGSAARGVFGKSVTIGKMRGMPHPLGGGSELWVTAHPSYLLRLKDEMKEQQQRLFQADLAAVAERLAELVG